MTDFAGERTLGIGALIATLIGKLFTLAQVDPSIGGTFIGIVTQFGGLGLAVWLVYYHTTTTVPQMQREFKEERQRLLELHKAETDQQKQDYFEQMNKLSAQHREDLDSERREFLEALKNNQCKYKS